MVLLRIKTNVPENRQVSLNLVLPSDTPMGQTEFLVAVGEWVDPVRIVLEQPSPKEAYPVRPSHPKLAQEFDAFQRLLPDLLETHRNQYAAVHDGKVIEIGADRIGVVKQAYSRCGYQAIYVAKVTDQPQPVERSGLIRELPPSKP
jgi:hypothetical protein